MMKRGSVLKIGLVLGVVGVFWACTATGEDAAKEVAKKEDAAKAKTYSYVKESKCKICHMKDASGAQYKKWAASAHAKAFETLGTDEAAAVAKKAGVEGSPQESADCLKCHVTGYGVKDELRADLDMKDGVTCQACHGPGEGYATKAVMQAVFDGETAPAEVGLTLPDSTTCTTCHNDKSPTFKGFDFAKMSAEIAHKYPPEMEKQRKTKQ
jgi:hypothetical protein